MLEILLDKAARKMLGYAAHSCNEKAFREAKRSYETTYQAIEKAGMKEKQNQEVYNDALKIYEWAIDLAKERGWNVE